MCYIIYLIIIYYMFIHVLSTKYIYLHGINNVVVSLFSLFVSQGGSHYETKMSGYVDREIIDTAQI